MHNTGCLLFTLPSAQIGVEREAYMVKQINQNRPRKVRPGRQMNMKFRPLDADSSIHWIRLLRCMCLLLLFLRFVFCLVSGEPFFASSFAALGVLIVVRFCIPSFRDHFVVYNMSCLNASSRTRSHTTIVMFFNWRACVRSPPPLSPFSFEFVCAQQPSIAVYICTMIFVLFVRLCISDSEWFCFYYCKSEFLLLPRWVWSGIDTGRWREVC